MEIGFKKGRLTVTKILNTDHAKKRLVECACDCGKIIVIRKNNLLHNTNSCGCFKKHLISTTKKKSREHHLKYAREISKKRYQENSKVREKKKEYYIKNKDRISAVKLKRHNARIKEDLVFKVRVRLRTRIQVALKSNYKKGLWKEYLGCSIKELKQYLESKFLEGMTWENYGIHGWHIDHIIPISSIKSSNPEDYKLVLHYTNLQPLWAKDNLSKGNKV